MADVPTRTLLDYLSTLTVGGEGGVVTRDLTIREDIPTSQQAVPPGGSAGEVLAKLGNADYDVVWAPAGAGTVQSVTINTANGFAGTSDGDPISPKLTISTTVTGILEGNGSTIAAASVTGTGNVVRATSPVLVTPNLGTPSAITLTNATGLPISTGVSGLGTGIATFLATPTSANLAAAITNETGSGSLVFATSPTLTTPTVTGALNISGASSGQIVFPATQNASSNINTLDDYEEGTWVPVLSATGSTFNYASRVASYTKIGDLVSINFRIELATTGNTTSSNVVSITGLPFVLSIGGTLRVQVTWVNAQTALVGMGLNFADTTSSMSFVSISAASTSWANANSNVIFSATAGTVIYGTFSYKTTT